MKASEEIAALAEQLTCDMLLAIGALAVGNDRVARIGQALYDARPFVAALLELAAQHPDEVREMIVDHVQRERRKP